MVDTSSGDVQRTWWTAGGACVYQGGHDNSTGHLEPATRGEVGREQVLPGRIRDHEHIDAIGETRRPLRCARPRTSVQVNVVLVGIDVEIHFASVRQCGEDGAGYLLRAQRRDEN